MEIINSIYSKLGFNVLHRISDIYSRILFSFFSHNILTTNISYNLFEDILENIDDAKKKNDKIVFNKKIVQKEDIEPFTEWLLVSTVKYITRNDKDLLAMLSRNIEYILH